MVPGRPRDRNPARGSVGTRPGPRELTAGQQVTDDQDAFAPSRFQGRRAEVPALGRVGADGSRSDSPFIPCNR